jgi:hypothetical protein
MRRRSPIEVRREIDLVEAMPCRIASMAGTEVRRRCSAAMSTLVRE